MVLLSWGWNQNSQLGHGDTDTRVVPQSIASLESSVLVQVVCGSRYTVALTKRGNVFTWGRGDDFQLGHAKGSALAVVPRLVQPLENVVVVAVAARGAHTLALSADGHVFAWGRNDEGQLGLGHREPTRVPTLVRSLVDSQIVIAKIACGRVHSVAVEASKGQLYTWGSNEDGATGQNVDEPVLEPAPIRGTVNVSAVACGSRHTLAIVDDPAMLDSRRSGLLNKLIAFGWGTYGQLGLGDRKTCTEPVEVQFPDHVRNSRARITQVACGYRHSLAVMEFEGNDGSVDSEDSGFNALWAWGWNLYGQLGVNTVDSPFSLVPMLVSGLPSSVHTVTGGGRHTIAVVSRPSDGARRMYAFGRNDDGQLGLGVSFSEQRNPARVRCFGVNVAAVAAGWSHSMCLLEEGGLAHSDAVETGRLIEAEVEGGGMPRSPSTQWLADRNKLLGSAPLGPSGSIAKPSRWAAVKARLTGALTAGNMDAGFGQFLNTLILLLNILSSLRFRIGLDQNVVVNKVVPGAAFTIFVSNIVFGGWAEFLSMRSMNKANRGDTFTALPHGISTVLFFAFMMLIMAPVFQKTGDAELAYRTGLASCFILGVLELPCLFLVDRIRKLVPRAAMMSAMAGVSLTFIAMTFTVQIFSNPAVAIVPLTIILVCYGSNVQLPYKIPAGLLALVLGTIIVFVAGLLDISLMDPASAAPADANIEAAGSDQTFFPPSSTLPEVLVALSDQRTWSSITVVIPLLIVNIVTNLSCLEGAAAVGDEYSTRLGLALDAGMTILGALCGNPFPTCIYIGHSAFKSMGATVEFSYLSAVSVLLLGILNGTSAVMRVVPEVAGVGVLMWIGIVVTAQAFDRDDDYAQESSASKSHAAAVAIGLLPALAAWCLQYLQATLPAVGTVLSHGSAVEDQVHVPFDKVMQTLEGNGVYVYGLISLSRGYLLSSIFLSSTLVEIIDRQFYKAALWMLLASALSFVGAVHSFELDTSGVSSSYGFPSRTVGEFPLKYAFAYGAAALLLFVFELRESDTTAVEALKATTNRLVRLLCRGTQFAKTGPFPEVTTRPPAPSVDFRTSSLNSQISFGSGDNLDEDEVVDSTTPLTGRAGKPGNSYNTTAG